MGKWVEVGGDGSCSWVCSRPLVPDAEEEEERRLGLWPRLGGFWGDRLMSGSRGLAVAERWPSDGGRGVRGAEMEAREGTSESASNG